MPPAGSLGALTARAPSTNMASLNWSDHFELQQPRMDRTHREFVALLAALEEVVERDLGQAEALARFQALLDHTVEHFAQEERWMAAVGFAPENCHSLNHAQVLKALRQVPAMLQPSLDRDLIRVLVSELGGWFPAHAQMMDAALAEVMVERGLNPETGECARPRPVEAEAITGCGGSSCS